MTERFLACHTSPIVAASSSVVCWPYVGCQPFEHEKSDELAIIVVKFSDDGLKPLTQRAAKPL